MSLWLSLLLTVAFYPYSLRPRRARRSSDDHLYPELITPRLTEFRLYQSRKTLADSQKIWYIKWSRSIRFLPLRGLPESSTKIKHESLNGHLSKAVAVDCRLG